MEKTIKKTKFTVKKTTTTVSERIYSFIVDSEEAALKMAEESGFDYEGRDNSSLVSVETNYKIINNQ